MDKETFTGILILLVVIAVVLFGGNKIGQNGGLFHFAQTPRQTQQQTQTNIQQELNSAQNQVSDLQSQLQNINDSKYKGLVSLEYVNRGADAESEYIVLRMSDNATTSVPITGWTLHSLSSGVSVTIPFGTQLYFSGVQDIEDAIVLYPGDIAYVITGVSPIGYSFLINKCSGYLSQFQTFIPYISTQCPLAQNEDLSSIPKTIDNNACFDYIDSYPPCKTQTDPLPNNWSEQCVNFITEKLNYSSCVDTHKSDADFYQKDWRIYLARSSPIWQNEREDIVLYDNSGKVVDELKY
jgi:hypothetical protein